MTETEKKVLLAHYIEGKTIGEIAKAYKVTREFVKNIIVASWREMKECKPGQRAKFAEELGITYNRDILRWVYER